ncbi:hypothetical protein QL285_096103 [Trifolium repens]|nr:hypothetical protein QL285_096103 [Trifolium repens]
MIFLCCLLGSPLRHSVPIYFQLVKQVLVCCTQPLFTAVSRCFCAGNHIQSFRRPAVPRKIFPVFSLVPPLWESK